MILTNRREDENLQDYFVRLCSNKDIYGLTFEDISVLMNKQNGTEKGESTYRKRWASFKEGMEYAKNSLGITGSKDSDILDDIEEKKLELQKERYKLQATKIESSRNLRQSSRFELFYENIKEAIISLKPPELNPNLIFNNNPREYLLGIGDIHYGANFKSVNNYYSCEEVVRRFELLLSQTKSFVRENKIGKLKIINVGDTIQGILRMSDLQLNEVPVVDCVVQISRIIADFLNKLSSECMIDYYHSGNSNHSQLRPLGTKASEIATEDMERIIINYISDLLSHNDNVDVCLDIDKGYCTFNIFDFNNIAFHGHQFKNIGNSLNNISNLHRKFYDYIILGHSHSAKELILNEGISHNTEVLVVPSFIGSDPYADSLMVGSKAAAKIFEFDKKYGHTASRTFILNG